MKVRVKAGKLFYKPDSRAARVYTEADGVFEMDDANAKAQIERGFVIACEEPDVPATKPQEVAETTEPQEVADVDLSSMTRAELIDYATANNITLPDNARSKAAILAAIESRDEDAFDAFAAVIE